MLNKEEKKSLTRLGILTIGWGLGLDRFYEGRVKDGFLSIVGWGVIFTSFLILSPCHGYDYSNNSKAITEAGIDPLIIFPLAFGAYGGFLIIRKAFRLLRSFESA